MLLFFHPRASDGRLHRAASNSHTGIAALFAVAIALLLYSSPAAAQQVQDVPSEEIVVNFAAGRVVIAVVKDAILIGTIEDKIEMQTHPPIPMAMNRVRAGILLGAVDWFSPSSQLQLARLDTELPHLRGHFAVPGPHMNQAQASPEASDIESVGQNLYERMN